MHMYLVVLPSIWFSGFIISSCIASCNFGTIFFSKNVSIAPLENTVIHGLRICFAETSFGFHRTRALANFERIVGYTISNLGPEAQNECKYKFSDIFKYYLPKRGS